jgi:hypothetical protein
MNSIVMRPSSPWVADGSCRSVDHVVLGNYKDLFGVIATSAATLTGLLFVAMSVTKTRSNHPPVIREFRAAAALLAFTNALAVSLFGLVPGTNIGYPAAVLGVIGVFFTVAGVRTTLALPGFRQQRRPQLYLILLLLLAFGFELAYGIALIVGPHRSSALTVIGDLLIASLLIGIARAWELVGDWDTGIVSSIALLIGHKSMVQGPGDRELPRDRGTDEESDPLRDPIASDVDAGPAAGEDRQDQA